jgi:proteasome lid subunit RPN8/RPN11
MPGKTFQNQAETPQVFISEDLDRDLIRICVRALPHKAFGLVGGIDLYHPRSLYPCSTNLRNTPEWKPVFESFGPFYSDPDLGFVISPPEVKSVLDMMESRRETFVGVFHSHRILCAEPTEIDIALSTDSSVLSFIVSVVNPSEPELGVFRLGNGGYQNIPIVRC